MLSEFRNEPYTDFNQSANRKAQKQELENVKTEFKRIYPLFIDGTDLKSDRTFKSYNPSNKKEVVGTFYQAGKHEVDLAMDAALRAFEKWKWISPQERAIVLLKAAQIMRRRKKEINAWMIYEAGKNWLEAEADTAEAIDFLDFYARQMIRLSEVKGTTPFPNELPELRYIPLGVGAIIPPWNFPMAIVTGMTSAAIVTGNTVLLKPAEETPCVGYRLVEIMQEAGLPEGVLNYIPGDPEEIGDYIVRHPKTRFISFTGSKEVGLRINELAAKPSPGQIWIKRVIAEMGGKDTIIVDSDADLENAAENIVASAFGFQGQKCSACSRVILLEEIYEKLLDKIIKRVKKITIGPVENPDNYLGPLISAEAEKKVLSYIAIGKKEGKLIFGGKKINDEGYFIEPTVFVDIEPGARLDQEEIFGPVLAVIRVKNFDEAISIANSTEFGLTGSVFSKNRYKIEKAKHKFHVGNLYINRKCTGAMVGAHPFGGFNMSGTDSKAGGGDYLNLFVQPKSISEKLI